MPPATPVPQPSVRVPLLVPQLAMNRGDDLMCY